jgi:flavin reductase (DIM6/NTAB) family NADH-FMN oxidoreductase RutF
MVSIERRGKEEKDTLRNVRETGEMVVHIVDENLMEKMVYTSGSWDYEINEFEEAGLESIPSLCVKPLRVKNALISLETKCNQIIPVKNTQSTMIIGNIICFNIREDILDNMETVNPLKLKPVGRLGGSIYTKLGTVFSFGRP